MTVDGTWLSAGPSRFSIPTRDPGPPSRHAEQVAHFASWAGACASAEYGEMLVAAAYEQTSRVGRMTTAWRTGTSFAVQLVQVGCTFLMRMSGSLSGENLAPAGAAIRAALDERPHALVIDLAPVTDIDAAGARLFAEQLHATDGRFEVCLVDAAPAHREALRRVCRTERIPVVIGLAAALVPHCR